MKVVFVAISLFLGCHAACDRICYAPQSESRYYLTLSEGELYVAQDFVRGQWLVVFGNDVKGDHWSIVDINTNITYINTHAGGCKYHLFTPESNSSHPIDYIPSVYLQLFQQCLPSNATLLKDGDLIDFYFTTLTLGPEEFHWLVGVTPVEGTKYYKRSVSRFEETNVVEREVGVLVDFSPSIADPTVFDKDLSVCVDGLI
ncbi:hypothetical protein PoB_002525200 [Plakobranchus ocellatus]|uniref:DOMON domain-containing protein n=1 Tax=Plakobranchus ocellatus TaxID=259542 RepID=A0AAV3ZUH3_9GAST|nr:hypothetical protein PoB_002525200 [Plakobranchus ocellatus]